MKTTTIVLYDPFRTSWRCRLFGHRYKWAQSLDARDTYCLWCGCQWWAKDMGYGLWLQIKALWRRWREKR